MIRCESLWKTFRIPLDRPYTIKQRVLHPLSSYAHRELHALRDVSLAVQPGEFFGVIGANGSGKSTLLKCLAGIYRPDRGRITVSGRVSPFIELGVGFNGELPALDNVVINASLLGIPPAEARRRFPEIVRFAELEEFVDLKLKNYSSGMHVRLGFAAAIQADADVLLADEVLAVGDIRFQEKCFETFRRFKHEGKTVLFVTHDLASVQRFCDRALLLHHGEVLAVGEPGDVINEYRQLIFGQEEAPAASGAAEPDRRRWGDRSAEITSVAIHDGDGRPVEDLRSGDWYTLRLRVVFHTAHEHPVVGLTVRHESGATAFAVNSIQDGHVTGELEPGESLDYALAFQALLGAGRYTLSPYVAYRDQMRFADAREDVVSFAVLSDWASGSIAELPHSSTLERSPNRSAEPQPAE